MHRCRQLLLVLASTAVFLPGCSAATRESITRSPYYPDRLTVGSGIDYNPQAGRVDRVVPAVSVSWRLKPAEVTPAASPAPAAHYAKGEGEAP